MPANSGRRHNRSQRRLKFTPPPSATPSTFNQARNCGDTLTARRTFNFVCPPASRSITPPLKFSAVARRDSAARNPPNKIGHNQPTNPASCSCTTRKIRAQSAAAKIDLPL